MKQNTAWLLTIIDGEKLRKQTLYLTEFHTLEALMSLGSGKTH